MPLELLTESYAKMAVKLTHLESGTTAPDFSIPTSGGGELAKLKDFSGKFLILYFYPKDNTPGCTTQAVEFTENKNEFETLNADILGVSRDSLEKHDKFIVKKELSISLGSDEAGDVTETYGVWVEKSMYGKTFMGIQRATFLIGPDSEILHVWPKVRVKGHVDEVLETLKTLAT